MAETADRIESVFAAAVELESAPARAAYLDEACANDTALRQQVELLLRAHQRTGHLLDRPDAGILASPALTVDSSANVQPGTVLSGRYKLLESIGEGGMGTVWVAEQLEPVRRKVAVKLVKAGMDSRQVLSRFEAERQALALMDHPHIAKVFDGGTVGQAFSLSSDSRQAKSLPHEGRPFFVMEYVKGVPITEYCDQARLSLQARLKLFVPVCQAIQHAHQKGIVHRDLKPSNILVCLYDGLPVPKVIDFGLAKAMHQSLTEHTLHTAHGLMVGTPLYMSPEQAEFNNLDIDTRSDIYSLGVILYELLTGSTPLEKQQLKEAALNEVLRLIKEVEPDKPSTRLSGSASLPSIAAQRSIEPNQLRKSLTGDLDWIVMKALDKERSRRYETANGLARDVERFLNDEAVEASPPSTTYRMKKFVRKHRVALSTTAAFALLLVIGTAVSAWQAIRATHAEGVARLALEAEEEQRQLAQEKQHEAEEQRTKAEASANSEAVQRHIAEEQKLKAEEAEAETLADYRASTDDAIEQLIGSKPELGPQEKAYLENSLKRWQTFANRQGDDERTLTIRAEGHFHVARLWQRFNRKEEAWTEYRAALDIYSHLAKRFPDVPEYQYRFAITHNNLGNLLRHLGKTEDALAEYQVARDVFNLLVQQFPTAPVYLQGLARTHNNLAIQFDDLGRREQASTEYRVARDIFKKLVEQFPATFTYQQELADVHNNLGILLRDLGKFNEARAEHLAARGLQMKLVDQFAAVPAYRHDLANTHNSLGMLLENMGKAKDAQAEYLAACALQNELVEQFPAIPAYHQVLAGTHNNLGALLKDLGKTEESLAEFQTAFDIRNKLAKQFAEVPSYQFDLASSHYTLAIQFADLGNPEESLAQYQAARKLQEKLVEAFPAMPMYKQELARTHNNLGLLFARLGNCEEARAQYQCALSLRKALVEQFPAVLDYQVQLGGSYGNYGILLINYGSKPQERLEWFDLAVRTLQPVYELRPRDATARQFLRESHLWRARVYDQLHKTAEAFQDWELAIELSPPAEQSKIRASRVTSRIQAGMVAEAVDEVADLTRNESWSTDKWYNFACVYSIASSKFPEKKQEYADRAMELLQKAVEAGFNDTANLRKDSDLDALHGRDDFKKLVDELEKKLPSMP